MGVQIIKKNGFHIQEIEETPIQKKRKLAKEIIKVHRMLKDLLEEYDALELDEDEW